MSATAFENIIKEEFSIVTQYAPILARVHGKNHPELTQVRDLVAEMNDKIKQHDSGQADLSSEFNELRRLTNDYEVPNDGCGTYVETYRGLEAADRAYHS